METESEAIESPDAGQAGQPVCRFCPNCGSRTQAGQVFCTQCGNDLTLVGSGSAQVSPTSRPPSRFLPIGKVLEKIPGFITSNPLSCSLMFLVVVVALLALRFYGLVALAAALVVIYVGAALLADSQDGLDRWVRKVGRGIGGTVKDAAQSVEWAGVPLPDANTPAPQSEYRVPETEVAQQAAPAQPQPQPQPTVIVNTGVPEKKTNGVGTAGFVFALLGLLFSWILPVAVVVWILGALLSFIGLFKAPRALAVVGFILSFIDVIAILALAGILYTLI